MIAIYPHECIGNLVLLDVDHDALFELSLDEPETDDAPNVIVTIKRDGQKNSAHSGEDDDTHAFGSLSLGKNTLQDLVTGLACGSVRLPVTRDVNLVVTESSISYTKETDFTARYDLCLSNDPNIYATIDAQQLERLIETLLFF